MISSMLDAASNEGRIAALFDEISGRYCEVAAAALRRDRRTTLSPDLDYDEVAALMIHGTQAYLKDRLGTPGRGDPLTVAFTLRGMWTAALYDAAERLPRDGEREADDNSPSPRGLND